MAEQYFDPHVNNKMLFTGTLLNGLTYIEGEEMDRLLPPPKKGGGKGGGGVSACKIITIFSSERLVAAHSLTVWLGQLLGVRFIKTYALLSMKSVCP